MKHNSKKFLALFLSAAMAVTPVSSIYAEEPASELETEQSVEMEVPEEEAVFLEETTDVSETEPTGEQVLDSEVVGTDEEQSLQNIEVSEDVSEDEETDASEEGSESGESEPDTNPGEGTGEESGDESEESGGSENPEAVVLSDGTYHVIVESSSSMFKVTDCVLTVKNGEMSAVITLSGTGYDKLYIGTAEDAVDAKEEEFIYYQMNLEGDYTYTIPVAGLDREIAVAAHSSKKDTWYDRTLIFQSEGMTKNELAPGGDTGNNTESGTGNSESSTGSNTTGGGTGNPSSNHNRPDPESKHESDVNGSTGRINSSTIMKDGVYTPDQFTWSGGTGRVSISCSKVTIKGGQAYATLVFSSDKYQYVKANGNVYYPSSKGGGMTTFVIPVELNKNNHIIGMTTAMSAAHEVSYIIFIYLAEADGTKGGSMAGSNEKLDDQAPDILGLTYESETSLTYAEYFKIYHYENGIILLEIDMTKDTARDPEKVKEEAEKSESEEDTSDLTPKEEKIMELYHGNVVKYLIVPEDVEIPAGLDKEMIVINQPVDSTYAAAEGAMVILDELGQEGMIAAVGCEKEDCVIESIADAMEEDQIVSAGSYEEPDYKKLLKSQWNLSIFPSEILPGEEDEKEEEEEKLERLEKIIERHTILEVPMLVDRSDDEEEELAKKEWIKVYGVLFGCEEKAAELFDAFVAEAE
ncbi:MAG: hypothetical protein ACI4S0_09530 [Dorea sp.]